MTIAIRDLYYAQLCSSISRSDGLLGSRAFQIGSETFTSPIKSDTLIRPRGN